MSVWKTPSNSRSSTRWDLRARIPSGLWTLVLWLRRRWTSSKRSWPSSEERPTLTPTSTAMTAWPRHPRSFCRTTTLMIFMKMIWWELWEFSESWKMEKWFNSFSTQCPFLSVCMKPIFLWCFKDALVEAKKTRFTTLQSWAKRAIYDERSALTTVVKGNSKYIISISILGNWTVGR